MTVTYDVTDLDKSTASGRLNIVRWLTGDTSVTTAELQDEEINFSLLSSSDNTYKAASLCAAAIASKFADRVNTGLDGALKADYGSLSDKYRNLSIQLLADGKRLDGTSLGLSVGGLPVFPCKSYSFYRGQFDPNTVVD